MTTPVALDPAEPSSSDAPAQSEPMLMTGSNVRVIPAPADQVP